MYVFCLPCVGSAKLHCVENSEGRSAKRAMRAKRRDQGEEKEERGARGASGRKSFKFLATSGTSFKPNQRELHPAKILCCVSKAALCDKTDEKTTKPKTTHRHTHCRKQNTVQCAQHKHTLCKTTIQNSNATQNSTTQRANCKTN